MRFRSIPLTGSLKGQILVSIWAACLITLGFVSALNMGLTLHLAQRHRQDQVASTLEALRTTWQASKHLPSERRRQLLQDQIDHISDAPNIYVVHPGAGSVLLPLNWTELPKPVLTAMLSQRHQVDQTAPLNNAFGESFEFRTYPFAGAGSHVHVAHNLSSIDSYFQNQRFLLLALFPFAALLSIVLAGLLSRRIVQPIVALDRQLQNVNPDNLQQVLGEIRGVPSEWRHHTLILQKLLARLAEARDSQAAFVSYVNHELRNSLMIMQGNLRWLSRSSNRFTPRQKKAFAAALDENRRLSSMVVDLLDLSNADAHRLSIPLQSVDVRSILEQCCDLASRAYERSIEIHLAEPLQQGQPLPAVRANPDRLTQILMNLLENAVKFSAPHSAIQLRVSLVGSTLISFDVMDRGAGIPADDQPHIFERFYRSPSTATSTSGSGLGLSLARLLSEAMGGTLDLLSSGPEGSIFRLTVPVAASPLASARSLAS